MLRLNISSINDIQEGAAPKMVRVEKSSLSKTQLSRREFKIRIDVEHGLVEVIIESQYITC